MAALRVLSIAVASGRAGYVFIQGTEMLDWGLTVKATRSASDLVGFVQELINELKPDVLVTEDCADGGRKGRGTRRLISAIADIASHNPVLDVSVTRSKRYNSKCEEAIAMVNRYPALAGYRRKRPRRVFDFEPRNMIVFEAVALAEAVIHGPPEQLAAAMG